MNKSTNLSNVSLTVKIAVCFLLYKYETSENLQKIIRSFLTMTLAVMVSLYTVSAAVKQHKGEIYEFNSQ